MKGFYLTKIFCFALVFIMTASLLPFNASAASQFPIYVRNMVDIKSRERQIEITISGMKFTGRMWNSALTQDKIDEIIFEVMEHMRIDGNDIIKYDQQIKKMLEIMGFSQKDFEQIVGNILTVAGLALGGKAGDVVTGAQILYDIICGKPGDAEKSVIEEAGKKIEEKAGGGALGKTKGWYGGGEMLAKEWVKSQVKFNQMRAGLDATREMNSFYNLVHSKIQIFCDKNAKHNAIQLLGVAAPKKTFSLYGAECSEKWTADMLLEYKGRINSNPNIQDGLLDGIYEGNYKITVEYDLSRLAEALPDLIWTPEWQKTGNAMSDAGIWNYLNNWIVGSGEYDVETKLTKTGELKATRIIKGIATARIHQGNGTITPSQASDEKDGADSPAVVEIHYTQVINTLPWEVEMMKGYHRFRFSPVKDGIEIAVSDSANVGTYWTYIVPSGDSMYQRGDNAKQGWIFKIMPRQ